ncbi:MAG: hypothetical protein ACK5MI_04320 [Mangrovibacterium sp.]
MSIIFGIIKFILLFLIFIFIIGFFALRKMQKKALNEMYEQQNPHAYEQEHEGEIEIEQEEPMGENEEFTDYEEMK